MIGRSGLRRRRAAASALAAGALARYYRVPLPEDGIRMVDAPILAVDLECTSLDLAAARILSVGHVPIDRQRVDLAAARYLVVNAGAEATGNVAVHGLTDDVIGTGAPLERAVEQVLQACAGRVLLAHHARIETTLLSRACQVLYGAPWHPPVIDTMVLERRILRRGADRPDRAGVDLATARERYGLPRYRSHHALTDAVACAELFLAQMQQWPGRPPTLGRVRLG